MPTSPGVVVRDSLSLTVLSYAEKRCTTMPELESSASTYVGAAANDTTYLGVHRSTLPVARGLIVYEEYHLFGTSSYRAADSSIEVSPKRYRYIGKERDEETGLDHMGARYYAPWLGRWTAADPIGLGDGVNRYAYVRGNPVGMVDPGGTFAQVPETPDAKPGFEHLGRLVTTGRGSGGKGPTLLYSEGDDPGPQLPGAEKENAQRERAAHRAERREAKRAEREAEVLETAVGVAVAQYERLFRAEDAQRVAELEKIADQLGYYPTGRVVSYFEPGQEGPRRVDQFRSDLHRALRQTEGRPFDERVAALEEVNLKALAGIDWRADAATDIAIFEAAVTFGAAVAGRGQGRVGPLAGVSDAEIATAVEAQGTSELPLKAPAPTGSRYNVNPTMMLNEHIVMSTSSSQAATAPVGDVATRLRVHTADPTAPAGSNAATGNTLGILQGSGRRRMLPGGRWIQTSRASSEELNRAHVPIHRGKR